MAKDYSSDTVILLQELEKTTKKALAEEVGISPSTMSKMLNKQIAMSPDMVRRLSARTDYPIEFFSSDATRIPVIDLTYRHTSKSSVSELNAVSAEFSLLLNVSNKISDIVGMHPRTDWIDELAPKTDDEVTRDYIEHIAGKTREFLGIPSHGAIKNITRSIECSGIVIAPLKTLTPLAGEEHLHSDGVTYPGLKNGTPVIGYSPDSDAGDRERFTKAHELGHLILHRYRRPTKYRDMENEAHAFAGALLMPLSDANVLISASTTLKDFGQLKAGWGISMAALISRGYRAGILSKDRWRSLFIQLNARGWKKNEPIHVGVERPLLLSSMIGKIYGDERGAVNSFRMTQELRMPFRYLDVWAGGLKEQGSELGFNSRRFDRRG